MLKFEEVVKTLKRFTVLWQRFIDDRHGQKKGERRENPTTAKDKIPSRTETKAKITR